jgi:ligand-binding SRPBCC domain-containing protein
MHNGLMILYEIQIPYFGKRRWLTEIKHIEEGACFVDEQRIGPYRLWYHQHRVEAIAEGKTRVIDRVFYQMPLGVLGTLVHTFRVRGMLEEIFDYRARRMAELFGQ